MGSDTSYANPRFGLQQLAKFQASGALNSTNASATELERLTMTKKAVIERAYLFNLVAGDEADKNQIVLAYSLAGTGTVTALGTTTLGTETVNTVVNMTAAGTLTAGDDLVLAHYGTSTEVYNVICSVDWHEAFDNS